MLLARRHAGITAIESVSRFWPAELAGAGYARAEWPAAAEDASLPDGLPELLLLLMLLGDGATFVVGVAFCALAVVAPANNAAASAIVVRLFIAELHGVPDTA